MNQESVDVVDGLDNFVYDKNKKERAPWKFCCTTIPRSEVVFFVQVFVILILLLFCVYKLGCGKLSCEENAVWVSLLSSVVGYILPNPSL